MENLIRIGLIDDHKIVRQGIKELLHKLGNIQVTHEFDSGVEFLSAIPLNDAPDMYILDYSMPQMNGIQVLEVLEKKIDEYRVLLLTQHFDEEIISQAYNAGARGFLNKNCTAQDLNFAIKNIMTVGYNNVSDILKRVKNFDEPNNLIHLNVELSERELEFLTLVCNDEEFTYEQMAHKMGLSVKSVEGYRAGLFDRYGIKSKVGLVLFSYKYKLTEPFL
ncbi:response regulator transcription factor [Flavobacterium sp. CYK-55]|uniref:response regulator transcription factor n=1 Tax=Flavobacterium sp. CYK-55 TaxID=2835529 RepID=UPI001BD04A9F|nr:response regulator transcription factor [Flavobacterium sp. CYK-55]MBS7785780.1 response regulator transcription factor [Flavobacterium sp. CYK-55]